jgi:betaine-aldehyde dehydrogenase
MDAVARHWIDGEAYGRPEADSLDLSNKDG